MDPREDEKRAAAQAAVDEVVDGMTVGLGTGSTVAHFLPALARRELDIRCVATSPETAASARAMGLALVDFDDVSRLDVAVDGADQVAPDGWLVKGGHGAQTREKVVAAAADRFVVIVSSDKLVERIGAPVPLEVLRFGFASILRMLERIGPCSPREGVLTPDANALVDYVGPVEDPAALAARLEATPGVIEHGLFPPSLVHVVLVGRPGGGVDRIDVTARADA